MNTSSNEYGNFGYLFTRGPNTTNFETGGHWDNPNRGYLNMNGDTDENRIALSVGEDYRGEEIGEIFTNSADKKVGKVGPTELSLINNDNDLWNNLASLSINDDGGNGWAGYSSLRGPNSANINMGARSWEGNPDLPYFQMFGTNDGNNDFQGIEISILPDGNGDQHSFINLNSQDGRSSNIGLGSFGLRGPNSQNLDMGSKEWEDKDFGYINMWGRNDGQNDFHAMEIAVSEDGNGDQFGYINLMSESGKLFNLSPDGIGGNVPFTIGNGAIIQEL